MHDDPDRDPIDTLAEEFVTAYRRGEEPSVDDYARRYPDLADDIRELFPAATLLEDLKTPPGTPRPALDAYRTASTPASRSASSSAPGARSSSAWNGRSAW